MRTFNYYHTVGFEETNVVGNVYYVNHLRWQGRCREMFLRENAPDILRQITDEALVLATVRVSCEYFSELMAFDELTIRMSLKTMLQNRVAFEFEYIRTNYGNNELIARGDQEIACMARNGTTTDPILIPETLKQALAPYANHGQLG